MAKRILKYPLEVIDEQELQLPFNAKILSVQNQGEKIVLYAISDENETRLKKVVITIVGTGHPTDCEDRFAGTVMMFGGQLVLHVFYRDLEPDREGLYC